MIHCIITDHLGRDMPAAFDTERGTFSFTMPANGGATEPYEVTGVRMESITERGWKVCS